MRLARNRLPRALGAITALAALLAVPVILGQSQSPAVADLRGTWRWTCCGGQYSGTFQIGVQSPNGTFFGVFGDTPADGKSPLSGRLTSTAIEFNRTILPANRSQLWKADLNGTSGNLKMLNGSWSGYGFVAGSKGDFRAEKIESPPVSGPDLRGTWRWTCCGGQYSGTFQVSAQAPNGTFSGVFGDTSADGKSPFTGRLTSTAIEFNRTILPVNQNQLWKAQLNGSSGNLKMINGSWSGYGFVAGSKGDFHAEKIGSSPLPATNQIR